MQWNDEAFIISNYKYGETSRIVTIFTKHHGLYSGLVRGVRKSAPLCQMGNQVEVTWKARLEEQLGSFSLEPKKIFAADIITVPLKLSALISSCQLIKMTIHEREPHTEIYDIYQGFICDISSGILDNYKWVCDYVKLELELLKWSGYGLDFSHCAASGIKENLCYVSPKWGKAVSEGEGDKYRNKLLKLPAFLRPECDPTYKKTAANMQEILDGLLISRYFFEKFFFIPHGSRFPVAGEQFREKLQEFVC